MLTNRFENVLDSIDRSLSMNRAEVLKYISENQQKVAEEILNTGAARIPTSAGIVVIEASAVPA